MMNIWYGKLFLLAGLVITILIRVPHDQKSRVAKIAEDRKGRLETTLLVLMGIGAMLLPLLFIATPLLSFADYALHSMAFIFGTGCLALNIWLFYRSHADLGTNWSVTLQIRDEHQLVDSGVYRKIRHPMYTAIFLYAVAQVLLLANWIAGPACLIAFTLMYLFRIKPEEKMMLEKFGDQYSLYMQRTKRLVPGVY